MEVHLDRCCFRSMGFVDLNGNTVSIHLNCRVSALEEEVLFEIQIRGLPYQCGYVITLKQIELRNGTDSTVERGALDIFLNLNC